MPALRAHSADVRAIAEKMIADMNAKHGCSVTGMTAELVSRLEAYKWPGNVRELRNVIERAVVLTGNGVIGVEHLPLGFGEVPVMAREDDGGRAPGGGDDGG